MVSVNTYDRRVTAILLDFFSRPTPWQRRLWAVGLKLGVREVLEGCEAFHAGVLSEKSLKHLRKTVELTASRDPGVGGAEQHRVLQKLLRLSPKPEGVEFRLLEQIRRQIERTYLARWSRAVGDPSSDQPNEERVARAIATHLLDSGFSSTYLHRWWSYRIHHEHSTRTLAKLLEDAHDLVTGPAKAFEVLVAFLKAPRSRAEMPDEWRSAPQVSDWLKENHHSATDIRQGGGMLFRVTARDPWSAIDEVFEGVERLAARIAVGTRSQLQFHGSAWIAGEGKPFQLRRNRRGVEIHALDRENSLYRKADDDRINAALELIDPLDRGSPGTAVSGGWAAIEALLLGPGDSGDRGVAGDRMASFVACSFPRAELTTLAYAHRKACDDELASSIADAATNRDRATLVGDAILNGTPLQLTSDTDRLAEQRLKKILQEPRVALLDIEQHAKHTLRRLYRQRNLVLHWGRTNAVGLRAALRTAAPLVGAGMDRVVHASFAANTSPLELAARARLRLEVLGSADGCSPVDLLEWGSKIEAEASARGSGLARLSPGPLGPP